MLKKYYLPLFAALMLFIFSKASFGQSVGFGLYYNSPSLKVSVGTGHIIRSHPRYIYYYDQRHKRHHMPYYNYYTHPRWFHHDRHFRDHDRGRNHERHGRH